MEGGLTASQKLSGASVGLHLYVEDCDKVYAQALTAGATQLRAVTDQFYGDRSGTLKDPSATSGSFPPTRRT